MPLENNAIQFIDWIIHSESIAVRGDGYSEHLHEVFKELFSPHSEFYKRKFPFIWQLQSSAPCRGFVVYIKQHLPSSPFFESQHHRRSRLSASERTQPSIDTHGQDVKGCKQILKLSLIHAARSRYSPPVCHDSIPGHQVSINLHSCINT